MKLELKHLTPYLPYGLRIRTYKAEKVFRELKMNILGVFDLELNCSWLSILEKKDNLCSKEIVDFPKIVTFSEYEENRLIKPILRPLSDLTKEIIIDGESFIPIGKLGTRYSSIKCMLYENTVQLDVYDISSINLLHYLTTFEKLYEMHFDIHNLIEKGLAIDINTIKEGGQDNG